MSSSIVPQFRGSPLRPLSRPALWCGTLGRVAQREATVVFKDLGRDIVDQDQETSVIWHRK